MKYPITVRSYVDPYYHYRYRAQEILDPHGKFIFTVGDLNECPEDAILGRSLFDAGNFIDAVRVGIQLAKDGYEDLEVSYEECNDDD